jgi:hypothetical protein
MRTLYLLLLLVLMAVLVHANSYLLTLQQKVAGCKAVLRVSLTEAAPQKADYGSGEIAVCNAKVVEVLKGAPVKEVTFRLHAYADFSPEKLPQIVKRDYVVFLHELGPPYRATNEFWVLQGPAGIRPIAAEYHEKKISPDNKILTETLTHSNFIAAIRAYAAQPEVKKK